MVKIGVVPNFDFFPEHPSQGVKRTGALRVKWNRLTDFLSEKSWFRTKNNLTYLQFWEKTEDGFVSLVSISKYKGKPLTVIIQHLGVPTEADLECQKINATIYIPKRNDIILNFKSLIYDLASYYEEDLDTNL